MQTSAGTCEEAAGRGADFRELAVRFARPHADSGFIFYRINAELFQCFDDDLLKLSHISADAQRVIVQSDNRVDHDLAGPVEGDIAAAIGLDDFYAEFLQMIVGGEEIFLAVDFTAPAEGDHRRMLDEQQAFLSILQNLRVDFFLQCPCIAVRHRA